MHHYNLMQEWQYSKLYQFLLRIPLIRVAAQFWLAYIGEDFMGACDTLCYHHLGDAMFTGGQPITQEYFDSWYGQKRLPLRVRQWSRRKRGYTHSHFCGSEKIGEACAKTCLAPFKFAPEPLLALPEDDE